MFGVDDVPGPAGEHAGQRPPAAGPASRQGVSGVGGRRAAAGLHLGHHQVARPDQGVYFDAYAMVDIYSRYIVGVHVQTRESGLLAVEFMTEIFAVHGIPNVVHADRGTSMTSKPVAALLADLEVTRSHSRPKVSNDNPYSESLFKTLEYGPAFPERFGRSTTPDSSWKRSSPVGAPPACGGTTTITGTAESVCTPPQTFTSGSLPRRPRSAPSSSLRLVAPIPNDSEPRTEAEDPGPATEAWINQPAVIDAPNLRQISGRVTPVGLNHLDKFRVEVSRTEHRFDLATFQEAHVLSGVSLPRHSPVLVVT